MAQPKQDRLSKREQQVMEILFSHGQLSASEIQTALPDPPTNSAVRSILRQLTEKGHIVRRQDGFRYLYSTVVTPTKARRSALKHLLITFFEGSPKEVFVELVDLSKEEMGDADWQHLSQLIEKTRKEEG